MKKSLLAGAAMLLGAAAAMSPIIARSADSPPGQSSQPASTAVIPPMNQAAQAGGGGGPGPMGGMEGNPGMGPQGMGPQGIGPMERHGWKERMMMHGGMMRMSPQQRCDEHIARRAGVIAYTIAKLNLTPQQRPLWDKVQGTLQASADKQRQLCATLKPREERQNETVLDRMNRREQFLSAHLQALQQIGPAMQQFYQSLTPDQQAIINHPFHRG